MKDSIKEIVDRTRRIETKLTRLITGEGDQGISKVEYVLSSDFTKGRIELKFNTRNVTIAQIHEILTNNRIPDSDGNKIYVHENNNPLFTIGGTL